MASSAVPARQLIEQHASAVLVDREHVELLYDPGLQYLGWKPLVVILMHATFNAVPRIMGPLFGTADVRNTPSMEIAIASGLGAVALVVIAVTRGKLGTKP